MIPSLQSLCQLAIIRIMEDSGFKQRVVKQLCQLIPHHLLDPIFDVLQEKEKTIINDVILTFFLIPSRASLQLQSSSHLKNSTLKQIGYHCPFLRKLDLSECVQLSNSVVRVVLQGCPLLSELMLNRCHRITDAAFDMSESPFQALVGCLSLEALSLQGCPQITGEIFKTLNKTCGNLKYLNVSQVCKHLPRP